MADVSLSSLKRAPRRETYVLTSSNASLAIPTWARGGKGIVYVTGCGGGGSGSGSGGHSSASAHEHPLLIPSGATTVGAVVGAGGTEGSVGGDSDISIGGVNVLRLQGGPSASGGSPAAPQFWNAAASAWRRQEYGSATYDARLAHAFASWALRRGLPPQSTVPAPGPFGGAQQAVDGAAGFGSGGSNGQPGGPGFLLLTFVEGF